MTPYILHIAFWMSAASVFVALKEYAAAKGSSKILHQQRRPPGRSSAGLCRHTISGSHSIAYRSILPMHLCLKRGGCSDWITMKFPPPQGAQNKGKTDYPRRRRWVRSRRQLAPQPQARPREAAPPPNLMDMDQEPGPAQAAEPEEERVVVGVVQPQEFLPLPPNWQSRGTLHAPITPYPKDEGAV